MWALWTRAECCWSGVWRICRATPTSCKSWGDTPEGLEILHESASGRLKTLIVRGQAWEISTKAAAAKPAYYDLLPLSLEEIFIYELGGVNYAVQDILL